MSINRLGPDKIDEISFWILGVTSALLPLVATIQTADIFGTPKVTWLRLIALFLSVLWGVRVLSSQRLRLPTGPLALAILFFIAILTLSTVFSFDRMISLMGLRKRFFGLSTYMALGLIFFSAASLTWSFQRLRSFVWLTVSGACLTSLVGIGQVLGSTWPANLKNYFGAAPYSTLGNPNFLGIYLVMAIPLALSLLLSESRPEKKLSALAILTILILGALLTRSSGALAGLVATVMAFFALWQIGRSIKQHIRITAIAIALLVVGTALAFLIYSDTTGWERRLAIWDGTLQVVKENPWYGAGPDMVRFAIPNKLPITKDFKGEIPEDGHNIFLTITATSGLPALALFVVIIYLSLSALAKTALTTGSRAGVLFTGFFAAIIAYLVTNFINPDNIVPLTLFWLYLGIASARRWGAGERRLPAAATLLSIPIIVALLAGVILTINLYAAEVHLARAEQDPLIPSALAEYQIAENLNPFYDWYSIRITDRLTPLVGVGRQSEASLALAAATRAIKKAPLETDNYAIKGTVYRTLAGASNDRRLLHKAVDLYLKALRINRYNLFAMSGIIKAYSRLGAKTKARFWIDRYLVLVDDPEIKAIAENL